MNILGLGIWFLGNINSSWIKLSSKALILRSKGLSFGGQKKVFNEFYC